MINTGTVSPLLVEGIRELVGHGYARLPLEGATYLNMLTTRKNYEFDRETANIGTMVAKAENAPVVLSDPRVGREKRYNTSTTAGGVRVSWEADADELYGFINDIFGGLGASANETMNVQMADIANNAAAASPTAEFQGFDGRSLLHTAHTGPDEEALSYNSNRFAVDLSESALQSALIQFTDVRDAVDNRIAVSPEKLLFHRDNMFLVREILETEGKPFSSDNTKNVLKGVLTPVMLNYQTDETQWMILGNGHKLNWFMRTPPTMKSYDDNSTLSMVTILVYRHAKGFSDWRQVIGSPGV
jgi:hypothetical protein